MKNGDNFNKTFKSIDKDLKYFIYEAMVAAFFIAHNNPACTDCHEKLKNNPHVAEALFSPGEGRLNVDIATISISGTATITTTSSLSSTSSTTTLPDNIFYKT